MNKEHVGLIALGTAVCFAMFAGGHVQLDALPDSGGAIGLLLVLVGSLLVALGAVLHRNDPTDARARYLFFAGAALFVFELWYGFLVGGAMFTTMRVFAALLVLGAIAYRVGSERVVQMPTVVYTGFTSLLVAALGTSLFVSGFKTVSIGAWLDWILYAAAMFLAVATLGRVRGPRALIEVIVFAAGFVALKGIVEYAQVRALEPTYRIFADWNNPNALAGMFVTALPLSLGLSCVSTGAVRVGAWTAGALMIGALALTQSLGGLLTVPIGVLALAIAAFSWRAGKRLVPALVPILAGVVLFGLASIKAPTPTQDSGDAPVAGSSVEQASSSQYRKLLWQGGLELFKSQPVGTGVGTYRFVSARPGLNEQTHLTHQSFLQVAIEGGVFAIVGLVGLGVAWTVRMFMGARALEEDRNLLRAAVFGAVVACAANGFLESNLYYFGTGLLFFVLLGTGLQLAADGTSPESLPKSLRATIVVVCCVLPLGVAVWAMYLENAKSALLTALQSRDPSTIEPAQSALESLAGSDGEAWYLLAWMKPEGDSQKRTLYEKAVEFAPTTRHLRGLAQQWDAEGNVEEALRTLDRALKDDPNNLRTLSLKMEIEKGAGRHLEAQETAKRMVAIEQTPYMQTRALAELVPTETYDARILLAEYEQDPATKARLLMEAAEGFDRYRRVTVPQVKRFAEQGLDFAGETRAIAEEKLARARNAAQEAADIYSALGDSSSSEGALSLAKGLTVD